MAQILILRSEAKASPTYPWNDSQLIIQRVSLALLHPLLIS